jgi:NADH dehydrogenase/NADH:ubiquinone oxidoreductase subunit G
MTNKSNSKITAWSIVAIIGLLLLNAYQWFNNTQINSQLEKQQVEMIELESIQAELEQEYQTALVSLEELRGNNKELNDLIDSQKKELTAQKEKINGLIWTKRELNKAKEEIKNMTSQAAGYVTEINKLQEENKFLANSNSKLSEEKEILVASYRKEQELTKELEEARKVLAAEKERLASNNENLSTKVDMANAIKINYMEVQGFEIKDNGDLKKKSKAKDIELFRTCLKTETNMVTPSGEKEFFVRLINPIGETVAIESNGGGVLINKLDESQVRYTYSGTFNYNNEDTEACLDWTLSDRLPKGEYDIEVYNNGFLVGQGNFKLK